MIQTTIHEAKTHLSKLTHQALAGEGIITATGQRPLTMPPDMAWLFPEYTFAEMSPQTHKGVIIERVLEKGSWEQLQWLFAYYGEMPIAHWVSKHGFRLLSKRSFALWRLALNIELYDAPEWAIAAKQMSEAW